MLLLNSARSRPSPASPLGQPLDTLPFLLLKASRKGCYAPGTTNADTFWDRVWAKALQQDCLPGAAAPLHYYSSGFEDDEALALAAADEAASKRLRHRQEDRPRLMAVA